jgi:hypothetical protein
MEALGPATRYGAAWIHDIMRVAHAEAAAVMDVLTVPALAGTVLSGLVIAVVAALAPRYTGPGRAGRRDVR